MLTATDSFVVHLDTEMAGNPPVYWFRHSAIDEHAGMLRQNTLNVSYLAFYEQGSAERCLTSLDLLAGDERQALAWLKIVRDKLIDPQVIPEYDYSDPVTPVATGRMVSWVGQEISFINVRTPKGARYVHFNATFLLLYVRD